MPSEVLLNTSNSFYNPFYGMLITNKYDIGIYNRLTPTGVVMVFIIKKNFYYNIDKYNIDIYDIDYYSQRVIMGPL